MAREIERKFLVKGDAWRALAKGTTYRQGYLNSAKESGFGRQTTKHISLLRA
jgi:CYTH domain-containing protein